MLYIVKSSPIYAVLEDVNNKTNQYLFDCDAHDVDYYDSFGWRFKEISSNTNDNIINGTYKFNLYAKYDQTENNITQDRYKLITNETVSINVSYTNKIEKFISLSNSDDSELKVTKGDSYPFTVASSALNSGTNVSVYLIQCKLNKTMTKCDDYYPNNGNAFVFEYQRGKDKQIINIDIPNNNTLENDDGTNPNITTYLIMNVSLCNGKNMITTNQSVFINTSNGSNNSLGEDAIVGIISGAFIIFGLAVWWLCLRHKDGDDGYRNINT